MVAITIPWLMHCFEPMTRLIFSTANLWPAAKKWRYRQFLMNGEPVVIETSIVIN